MTSLCEHLRMNFDLRSRCWTCLEYIILNCYWLFKDHFLDQLIICCVYAVGRSTVSNWSFNEILRWYRTQECCRPEVYRKVRLSPIQGITSASDNLGDTPEYGDLITYYNKVFLSPLNKYLYVMFNSKNEEPTPKLSALPRFKSMDGFQSQRVLNDLSVYVSPKKDNLNPIAQSKTIYQFPNSPFSVIYTVLT
ncbi:hypothetical protein MXB_3402 [Myxobolus squamalis]|nr:hypothetical protein MXB_3402 [Myxobolus squamalis]